MFHDEAGKCTAVDVWRLLECTAQHCAVTTEAEAGQGPATRQVRRIHMLLLLLLRLLRADPW
jgi:hypothetical protein